MDLKSLESLELLGGVTGGVIIRKLGQPDITWFQDQQGCCEVLQKGWKQRMWKVSGKVERVYGMGCREIGR